MKRLDFVEKYGPWAVIAGGSQGLGEAFARQLAVQGINLVLVARHADKLNDLSEKLSSTYAIQVHPLPLDLSLPDAAQSIFQQTSDLDIGLLINNAALSLTGPLLEHPLVDHLREINVNIQTPLALTYLFGQGMLARGRGGILFMSSLSAFQGSPYIANYAASKAFDMVLAESLWDEWRPQGVDVLACIAGSIRTPNYVASEPHSNGSPANLLQEPEDVAQQGLDALGKQPYVITGFSNRLASAFMRHILPRSWSIRMMGRVLSGMYLDHQS